MDRVNRAGAPCCSPSGWCGGSPDFCDCPGCRRFLKLEERKNAGSTALDSDLCWNFLNADDAGFVLQNFYHSPKFRPRFIRRTWDMSHFSPWSWGTCRVIILMRSGSYALCSPGRKARQGIEVRSRWPMAWFPIQRQSSKIL